jgi:DNA-binding transcriptional LysR family regulator
MDLRQLRYFAAVAEHLHFGRAAEYVHVVQSAVSLQIKSLEEELGVQLLERSRREVKLTASGQLFLPQAKQILKQAESAIRLARAAVDGAVGLLNIGFVDNCLWSLLPPLLRDFRQRYPAVELSTRPLDRQVQLKALREGAIDIGIIPGPIPNSEFVSTPFVTGPLLMAVPEGHAFARHHTVPLASFANESFVLFPPWMRSRLLEIVQQACVDAGFAPIVGQEAEQLHTLLALVAAGMGVTLVPKWVADARPVDVAFVELAPPQTQYGLFLVSRPQNPNPALPLFKAIADQLTQSPPRSRPCINGVSWDDLRRSATPASRRT